MEKPFDVHKAGGLMINERKLLVVRSIGKDFFATLGGKIESNETPQEALSREISEEVGVRIDANSLVPFGTFYAIAGGSTKRLRMDIFRIGSWQNRPSARAEIEELRWVNSADIGQVAMASILEHEIIPRLKAEDVID